jgi:hypothetical protein
MKKGERKCQGCARIIPSAAPRCYAQKVSVRNYRKTKHWDSHIINKIVYYTTMLVCQRCVDEIGKADVDFRYEIPPKYLMKRKTT